MSREKTILFDKWKNNDKIILEGFTAINLRKMVKKMLDFEKELENFKPSTEIEEVPDEVRHSVVSDVADLIKEILGEAEDMGE